MRCPECDTEITDSSAPCPECGKQITNGDTHSPKTSEADEKHVGEVCPYCLSPIRPGDPIIVCPNCEIPHHRDCWFDNDGCTTYGCHTTADRIADSFPEARSQGAFRSAEPKPDISPKLLEPVVVLSCSLLVISPALLLLATMFRPYGIVLSIALAGTILFIARTYSRDDAPELHLYIGLVLLGIIAVTMVVLTVAHSSGPSF
ncbi:MAG: RING finger protein [Armatimonadota bacterium]